MLQRSRNAPFKLAWNGRVCGFGWCSNSAPAPHHKCSRLRHLRGVTPDPRGQAVNLTIVAAVGLRPPLNSFVRRHLEPSVLPLRSPLTDTLGCPNVRGFAHLFREHPG